ncbi:MAG: fimbrillin family protein [Bacteroidales bacterium]|nr:fimbrillin family protein [Bacteroidales bacterium]
MNNWFKITLLAALAVPLGCSEMEVDEAPLKAVSFAVGTYSPQTRADGDPVSVIDQDGITAFTSRGFLHSEGFIGTAQEFGDFFGEEGQKISWHADTKEWLPPHDYYWPKGQKSYIDFISWYGGSPEITYAKNASSNKFEATFAWNNVQVAATDNLMWADLAWRYKANVNPATYGKNEVAEGVPTLFHHALSQVRFVGKVSKSSETVNGKTVKWTVNVKEFSISDVANKGTFSLTNVDPGGNEPKTQAWTVKDWTNLDGEATITPSATYPITLTETETEKEIVGWQSVIPQSTDAVKMTIKFSVVTEYEGAGGKKVEEEVTASSVLLNKFKTGTGDNDYIKNWERNKRYTYTIIIEPDTGIIKLIPVEKDWIDAGIIDITVE